MSEDERDEKRGREGLIAAIGFEIESCQRRSSAAGLSTWALLLAGAALVGFLLEYFTVPFPRWGPIAASYVGVSLLADTVVLLRACLRVTDGEEEGRIRVLSLRRVAGGNGMEHLVDAVRPGLLVLATWVLRSELDIWRLGASLAMGIAGIAFWMLTLALKRVDVPLPWGGGKHAKISTAKLGRNLTASLLVAKVLLLAVLVGVAPSILGKIDAGSLRIALLVLATHYVASRLASRTEDENTIDVLSDLRTNLLLGRLDVPEATMRFDAALAGHKIEEFIGVESRGLLEAHEAIGRHFELLNEALLRCEGVLDRGDSPSEGLADVRRLVSALPDLRQRKSEAERAFARRLQWLEPFVDLGEPASDLKRRLDAESAKQDDLQKRALSQWENIERRLSGGAEQPPGELAPSMSSE